MSKEKPKIKEAAALKYSPEEDAPKIVALGKGTAAEKILEKAEESGVPVHEDAELAGILNKMDIGQEIPPELYQVVAEILAFINNMDRQRGKERQGKAYQR